MSTLVLTYRGNSQADLSVKHAIDAVTSLDTAVIKLSDESAVMHQLVMIWVMMPLAERTRCALLLGRALADLPH
jgi:hypothetical protein